MISYAVKCFSYNIMAQAPSKFKFLGLLVLSIVKRLVYNIMESNHSILLSGMSSSSVCNNTCYDFNPNTDDFHAILTNNISCS